MPARVILQVYAGIVHPERRMLARATSIDIWSLSRKASEKLHLVARLAFARGVKVEIRLNGQRVKLVSVSSDGRATFKKVR